MDSLERVEHGQDQAAHDLSPEDIARAFSGHRFADTYQHLRTDVRWDNVNGPTLIGRDAVIAACEESHAYLSGVTTTVRRLRVIAGQDAVVIDSVTEYLDAGEISVVSSCDLYDFVDGQVAAITSYTVELEDS